MVNNKWIFCFFVVFVWPVAQTPKTTLKNSKSFQSIRLNPVFLLKPLVIKTLIRLVYVQSSSTDTVYQKSHLQKTNKTKSVKQTFTVATKKTSKCSGLYFFRINSLVSNWCKSAHHPPDLPLLPKKKKKKIQSLWIESKRHFVSSFQEHLVLC